MNENNDALTAHSPVPKLALYLCTKCDTTIEALLGATVWCRKGHLMERISDG